MTGRVLFVAVSEYLVPLDEVEPFLDEHRRWVRTAYEDGVVLVSGRRDPATGGVLVFRSADLSAAEQFVATDPFSIAGVSRYALVAFEPTSQPWRSAAYEAFESAGEQMAG